MGNRKRGAGRRTATLAVSIPNKVEQALNHIHIHSGVPVADLVGFAVAVTFGPDIERTIRTLTAANMLNEETRYEIDLGQVRSMLIEKGYLQESAREQNTISAEKPRRSSARA